MVSKQSAQDRHVTEIAVGSCYNRHASLGNWNATAMSVELTTSRVASHNANHYATNILDADMSKAREIFRIEAIFKNLGCVRMCELEYRHGANVNLIHTFFANFYALYMCISCKQFVCKSLCD